MKLRLWLTLAGAVALNAQPPPNFEESVKAAMAPSITQQRGAVRQQAAQMGAASPASPAQSFFTTPFVLATSSSATTGTADCDPLPREQLEPIVQKASQESGVDAQLVHAVIDQESAGRPCALSAKGAEGLMQLMPATAEDYDVDDPFDPQQNVEAGAKLLRSLLDRYGNDPSRALGAYNAGPTRVDQAGGVPAIPETKDYVSAILEKLGALSGGDKTKPANPRADNSGWQIPLSSVLSPASLTDF